MIKLAITLNKTPIDLVVEETKPLSEILYENFDIKLSRINCNGRCCGGCLVLVESIPVLGCLYPAFKLQGKTITTFDAFKQTSHYRNIKRTYDSLGLTPCPDCYEPKTLIIESILLRNEIKRGNKIDSLDPNSRNFMEKKVLNNQVDDINEQTIADEFSLSSCKCMDPSDLLLIVKKAREDRIKRHVR